MTVQHSVIFLAPLDRVWALFIDPERWAAWNTEWAETRDVRGPFDHAGAGYTQVLRILGREYLGTWEVAGCEPQAWREVRGTLPLGIPFRGRDEFRAVTEGTEVKLEVAWDTPWGGVGRVIEWVALPWFRRQLGSNAARAVALLRNTG